VSWFEKLLPSRIRTESNGRKKGVPGGIWTQCPACAAVLYRAELERNLEVCPKCDHHLRINARVRLQYFLDDSEQEELGADLEPVDKLKFRDSKRYRDRIVQAQRNTGEKDALVVLRGELEQRPMVAAAFEFGFMGGSMGAVVGERFRLAVECCVEHHIPLVCFSASGGARMQEGLLSLMQMAKTSLALTQLNKKRIPFISVMTDPTMGGVSASLAMLGDINIAEPKALIGFAGQRVIKETVRETLPEGFQRSEFLLDHGAVDLIADRRDMRRKIANLIGILGHYNRRRNGA